MNTPKAEISDRAVSYLRTFTPVIWGSLIATILRVVSPHLPTDVGAALASLLGSELALTLVTAVVIWLWYWLWRRVEPRIPDWLTRLVLGSAKPPAYAPPLELTDGERDLIRDVRLLEDRPQ